MAKKKRSKGRRKSYVTEQPFVWDSGIEPPPDQPACDVCVDLRTGKTRVVALPPGSHKTYLHYLNQHVLLPIGIELWSATEVRAEVEALVNRGFIPDWEQALMILAHHRSERAVELLISLKEKLPTELEIFWQFAYGEALGWIGYDYYADQSEPQIVPSGAAPDQVPN